MKRALQLLAFVALPLAGAIAEEAEVSTEADTSSQPTPVSFDAPAYKRRPFVVSVAVRGEYDNNIFTAESNRIASWKAIAEPEFSLDLSNSRSALLAHYKHSTTYYENRPGDQFDFAHYADFSLSHEFSSRLSVNAADSFQYTQEPELTQDQSMIRRLGNFFQNNFQAGGSFYLTKRLFLNANFGHDWYDYEDPIYSQLDRVAYTFGTSANFMVSPRTLTGLWYQYIITDFKDSPRDSKSHLFYAGLLQQISPVWTATLQGGGQYRKAENAKADLSPFAAAVTTYHFLPSTSGTIGYNISLQDTDVVNFNYAQTQHAFASLTSRLSYDLTCTIGGDWVYNEFPGAQRLDGSAEDANEEALVYRISLSYSITPQWSSEFGFSYTEVDSSLPGRDYDRSLASAGMRYTY